MNKLNISLITLQNNIFSGLFVGQNLVSLKEIDSTNNYLKLLLSNSKPVADGTVIMAESQYAGRGQQQNRWHSEPGKNLTFSLLLQPHFLNIQQQFDLTRIISLGVVAALTQVTQKNITIKWPNDIYYNNKKLGGMLIENIIQGTTIKNSIIGIGLNVNQAVFPPEVPNPVSLVQILHTDYDLLILLSQICSYIEAWYLKLKAGKINEIREAYRQRLYWLNQERYFESDNVKFKGIITDVLPGGLLLVNTDDGPKEFNLKQIVFLNKHESA